MYICAEINFKQKLFMALQKSKRQCKQCKIIKPLESFDTYTREYGIAYKTICKECLSILQTQQIVTCTTCKKDKLKQEFPNSPHSHLGVETVCKLCKKETSCAKEKSIRRNRDRKGRYNSDIDYKWKRLQASTVYRKANKEKILFQQAKIRARRSNLDFDINISDINIPDYCPILHIPLIITNSKRNWNSPSLDRINNSKGYIQGNIKIISMLANHMKAHATKDQLLLFAQNIPKYLENMI